MGTTGVAAPTTDGGVGGTARRAARALERRATRWERSAHRRLLSVGSRVECPICGWHGVSFAASRKPRRMNRLCPDCLSSERDRALQLWLDRQPVRDGARLLEVAPLGLVEPVAARLGYDYLSVDLHSPRAKVRGDLCGLPFPTGSVDVIACFHVLEHVPADVVAAAQIARVLRDDGTAVLIVPWDQQAATTDEDLEAGPEERLRRFGQSDHVRMYGRDVSDRFRAGGLDVTEVLWRELFSSDDFRRCALDGDDDRFWICRPAGR